MSAATTSKKPAAAALQAGGTVLIQKPWLYLGISRSAFFRSKDAGAAPRPVGLPGSRRPVYRRADLDRWAASLKTIRGRTPRQGTGD